MTTVTLNRPASSDRIKQYQYRVPRTSETVSTTVNKQAAVKTMKLKINVDAACSRPPVQ